MNIDFDSYKTYNRYLKKTNPHHLILSGASFESRMEAVRQTKSDIDSNYEPSDFGFADEEKLIETYFQLAIDKSKGLNELGFSFVVAIVTSVLSSFFISDFGLDISSNSNTMNILFYLV